jgi:hypothetical protein
MEKKKSFQNKKVFKSHVDFLVKNGLSFQLKLSNYTNEIICHENGFFNLKHFYSEYNPICFVAFQKIKKDILKSGKPKPEINKYNCTYFDLTENIVFNTFDLKNHYNMDLKSAYISILYRDGFITKETFDFVCRLPKKDRLVCVGMLASHKDIFIFTNGKLSHKDEKVNEMENYFFYCVDKTANVMRSIRAKLENDFIFSWVDSVYFFDNDLGVNAYFINNILNDFNLIGK